MWCNCDCIVSFIGASKQRVFEVYILDFVENSRHILRRSYNQLIFLLSSFHFLCDAMANSQTIDIYNIYII